jgi:hypothetical protein
MRSYWKEVLTKEIESWPGVSSHDHEFGGIQFDYGRVEIGHIHDAPFVDLPFPKAIRNQLIAEGRASVHPPLPNSGWARRYIQNESDLAETIALFRLNYERIVAQRDNKISSQTK